jgi:hypothetical protein
MVAVHVNVVPATVEVRGILVAAPVQIKFDAGVAVATGRGFTVSITVIASPTHPLDVGVTVYVAVPAVLAELFNACIIVAPEPSLAPVIPADCITVHANVVPVLVDDRVRLVEPPLQNDSDVGVAVAVGFISV